MEGGLSEESISALEKGIDLVMSRWSSLQILLSKVNDCRELSVDIFLYFDRCFTSGPPPTLDHLRTLIMHSEYGALSAGRDVEQVTQRLMAVYESFLEGNSITNEIIMEIVGQEVIDVKDYECNDEDYDEC